MVIELIRFLLWLLLCVVAALVEYATGIPVLTITVIALALWKTSTAWFVFFTFVASLVLAALYIQPWSAVWLIIVTMGVLLRSPIAKQGHTILSYVSQVIAASLVLAAIREPSVTISFVLHSLIGMVISTYCIWRRIKPKTKGLDIGELRFFRAS